MRASRPLELRVLRALFPIADSRIYPQILVKRQIYNARYIRINGQVRNQLSLGDATHYGGGNPGIERPGYHQIPLCGKSQLPFSRGGKSHWAFLAERDSMVAGGFNPTEGEAVMRS
jgi:hypothetical protein